MRSDLLAMTTEELRRLKAVHRLAAGTTAQARIAVEFVAIRRLSGKSQGR